MRIFILTDLEGPAGVNGRGENIGNTMLNIPTAEQALVNELNAVCDGLAAAGAEEIVIFDGHGGSSSIDIMKLHPKASLMQAGSWMPAVYLDGSYDAFIQIGTHSMEHTDGCMCHTFNSHGVQEMRLNGELIGEIGISSHLASYFGVPTIMVSGDDTACCEARALLGDDLEVVPTKSSVNRYTTVNYPLQEVYAKLRDTAERALMNLQKAHCLKMAETFELVIRFMCPNQANAGEKIGLERVDEFTIKAVSDDFADLWRSIWAGLPVCIEKNIISHLNGNILTLWPERLSKGKFTGILTIRGNNPSKFRLLSFLSLPCKSGFEIRQIAQRAAHYFSSPYSLLYAPASRWGHPWFPLTVPADKAVSDFHRQVNTRAAHIKKLRRNSLLIPCNSRE